MNFQGPQKMTYKSLLWFANEYPQICINMTIYLRLFFVFTDYITNSPLISIESRPLFEIMATVLEFLSSSFFNTPVSPDPYATHWVVGIVYKLHTMTGSLMFFFR